MYLFIYTDEVLPERVSFSNLRSFPVRGFPVQIKLVVKYRIPFSKTTQISFRRPQSTLS